MGIPPSKGHPEEEASSTPTHTPITATGFLPSPTLQYIAAKEAMMRRMKMMNSLPTHKRTILFSCQNSMPEVKAAILQSLNPFGLKLCMKKM